MKKSYARRMMTASIALILITIVVLDSVLLMFVWQYFKQDKYNLLKENVDTASVAMQEYVDRRHDVDLEQLAPMFDMLASAIDASIVYADHDGAFVFTSYGMEEDEYVIYGNLDRIPKEILLQLDQKQEMYDANLFGGMCQIRCYTYAKEIKDSLGHEIGYIVASIPIKLHLSSFMSKMLQICLMASIPVMVMAGIICYLVAERIVKPLRLAASAAGQFSKGDFTARLPVDSEDEIGILMRAMNNMAQSLAANDSIQRSFVSNVSHELKTPMTSISGFIDGILDGTIPKNKERYYLQLVSDEVKRLSRLVRSMLNLAKIEAGQMSLNMVDFNVLDTVIQVVLSFESRIEASNIEIRGLDMDPLYVNADEDLVHQVLYNLVENAVKFTNENGYIAFDIYRKESRVYIGVQNSGLGLTKDELENVFKRFYKSDRSRGLDKTGFGLGLYIVRSIVAAHHGEVEVESIEGEYCRFTVSFPEAKETQSRSRRR